MLVAAKLYLATDNAVGVERVGVPLEIATEDVTAGV